MDKRDRTYRVYGLFCSCARCRTSMAGEIRYVGATVNSLSARLYGHLQAAKNPKDEGYNTAKYRWIRSHGPENIRAVLLDEGLTSPEEATRSEQYWITNLNTLKGERGLNMSTGGEGVTVRPTRTPAQVRAASEYHRGRKRSQETRDRISAKARLRTGQATGGANGLLSDDLVRDIKARIWDGVSPSDIAEEYGLTHSQISHVSNNRTWTHVAWPCGPRRKPVRATPRKHSEETRKKMSDSHRRRNHGG